MYGIINEQTDNLIVTGNYQANDCDELHAFQGTGGKIIGDMNGIVKNKIDEWNSKGINVMPVSVKVNVAGMKVSWEVRFTKSDQNYDGFTSRGAGCNNEIIYRAGNDKINNGKQSVIKALSSKGVNVLKIEEFAEFTHNGGQNSFKQVFYRYITDKNIQQNKSTTQPIVITGSDYIDFKTNIKDQTKNLSIDWDSAELNLPSKKLKLNTGNDKLVNLSLIWDNISEDNLLDRYKVLKRQNEEDGYTVKEKEVIYQDGFWFLLIAILK